jgi:hypothetical protein
MKKHLGKSIVYSPGSLKVAPVAHAPAQLGSCYGMNSMRSAYPKLFAGILMFTLLGLTSGAAVGLFLFLASLPMVQLFDDPATVSQIVIVVAAFAGIVTAAIVIAIGSASWKKRLEAELYHAHVQNRYSAPPTRHTPPPLPRRQAGDRWR